ncbi:nickel pincer cofactor biosynthesis protein LarC [Selenomonas sp. KH1T6]|uniref:nickel pincer cofactor biosynthesis protein LarC n=1 Tax=Selenomonas sp. KH1T6 TaxID=3158784 RepID=UPI0008A7BCFF|nr:hypothetical protein SAMN05216583_101210 [Selenomonas ruminantium]
MKAIYLDCFSGISGNMLLGAFLQSGVPFEYLNDELQELGLHDEYELKANTVSKNGIAAVYVEVLTKEQHGRDGSHEDGHHHHSWGEICKLIRGSGLTEKVRDLSCGIFGTLAAAEGKIHGMNVDDVVFHEVGALDSIVDIVGSAICLEYLDIEKVLVSRINTGSGFVRCAHGLIPVPAPATAELLLGLPTYHKGAERELTTPTGAAFLKSLASYEESLPVNFKTESIAYGAGTWDLEIPNVLRMYLGELL